MESLLQCSGFAFGLTVLFGLPDQIMSTTCGAYKGICLLLWNKQANKRKTNMPNAFSR